MAAPTLNPTTTYEDGNILFDWDQTVNAVSGATSALTVSITNRGVVLNFDNDDPALDITGSVMTLTTPQPVYIGDTVTVTIGEGFVENEADEPNAIIEDSAVLNRSVVAYPTRTISFSGAIGGTITLSSPGGPIDFTVNTGSLDFKA